MAYRRGYRSSRGRSFRRGSSSKGTLWIRSAPSAAGATAGGSVALDLLPDASLDPGARVGSTITRVHLVCQWQVAGAQTFTPTSHVSFGMIAGRFESGLNVPNPMLGGDEDRWMLWDRVPISEGYQAFSPTQTTGLFNHRFDVKSKRVLHGRSDKLWLSISPSDFTMGELVATASVLVTLH